MTVSGISGDLYYINNPILLDIKELEPSTAYVAIYLTDLITVGGTTKIIRLYPNLSKEVIDYDLSELIKANFPKPNHPTSAPNDSAIQTNYRRFNIVVYQFDESGTQDGLNYYNATKTFLRGGEDSQRVNVSATVGDVLSDTPKLLLWGGLPISKYYINSNKEIASTTVIGGGEITPMKIIGCDPFYIRFLNSKGGYSYWLFPVWEKEKKTTNEGFVQRKRPHQSFSLGYKSEGTIKAESRIKREYYALAESLVTSQEIHVYNMFGAQWSKIEIKSGSFIENTYEDIAELNCEFNLNFTNDERLIW